jgi:hypothetical protein
MLDFATQLSANINGFFLKSPESYQCNLEAGIPIVHFFPLTDRDYEIKVHVLEEKEFHHIKDVYSPTTFKKWGTYRRKKFERNNKACPISHLLDRYT